MPLKKIHLACGRNVLAGWENYDLRTRLPGIQKIDLLKPFPFKKESVDFVFIEHAIEHFDEKDGYHILSQVYHVLKKGGQFRVSTPSLNTYVRRFLDWEGDWNKRENHHQIFRNGTAFLNFAFYGEHATGMNFLDGPGGNKIKSSGDGHKFIYSLEDMTEKLSKLGFTKIEECTVGCSNVPEFIGLDYRPDYIDLILDCQK